MFWQHLGAWSKDSVGLLLSIKAEYVLIVTGRSHTCLRPPLHFSQCPPSRSNHLITWQQRCAMTINGSPVNDPKDSMLLQVFPMGCTVTATLEVLVLHVALVAEKVGAKLVLAGTLHAT